VQWRLPPQSFPLQHGPPAPPQATQFENKHTWVELHCVPQPPQLFGSPVSSTQVFEFEQKVNGAGQAGVQFPPEQVPEQFCPQPPQFALSVWVSTQEPLQTTEFEPVQPPSTQLPP
jgi:hypothetical protein